MNSGHDEKNKHHKELMISYWWEKSHSSLESAKRETKAEAYDFAVNRLY